MLEELLTLTIVKFFSWKEEKLSNRILLKILIYKITSILHEALDEDPLSYFNVNERLRWKGDRRTKWDEDTWYSLSGIFGQLCLQSPIVI